jgi:hypothetical protein
MVQGQRQSHQTAQAGESTHDGGPPGEAEAIARISSLCWMGRMSAESVAEHRASGRPIEEHDQYEYDRYHKLRKEAADLADTLTDEFYRNAATEMLCGLCMTAGDEKAGRSLFELIETDFMREKALKEFPQLAGPRLSDVIRNN